MQTALKPRLPGLDALRAFAIAWVIAFHLEARDNLLPPGWLRDFVLRGVHGVTVFFVISGFLITTLLLDEEERAGKIGLKGFYVRRGFRILPAAMTYLAVALGIRYWAGLEWQPAEWLGSAFFYRNLVSESGSHLTDHFWSLSVEEQFYFIWPLLLAILPRGHRLWTTLALCAFAPVWRHIVTKMAHGEPFQIARIDLIYDSLLIGALLALLQRCQWFRRLFSPRWLAPVALAFASLSFFLLVVFGLPFGVLGAVAGPTLLLGCVAIVIKVLTEGHCAPVQAVCSSGPIVWIGRLSYSLYLWQTLFCSLRFPHPAWTLPWNLLAAVACGAASYYLVEQPMLRLRARFA